MSDVSHLATDKDIASMLLDLSNIISVLIGGAIGFIAKYFLEFKKMKEDKKSIRQQMITNNIAPMRQEWIEKIRDNYTLFLKSIEFHQYILYFRDHPIITSVYNDKEVDQMMLENVKEFRHRYYTLDILLPSTNHDREEILAEQIRQKIENLIECFRDNGTKETIEFNILELQIKSISQDIKELLKKEWEVTKSLKEIE